MYPLLHCSNGSQNALNNIFLLSFDVFHSTFPYGTLQVFRNFYSYLITSYLFAGNMLYAVLFELGPPFLIIVSSVIPFSNQYST